MGSVGKIQRKNEQSIALIEIVPKKFRACHVAPRFFYWIVGFLELPWALLCVWPTLLMGFKSLHENANFCKAHRREERASPIFIRSISSDINELDGVQRCVHPFLKKMHLFFASQWRNVIRNYLLLEFCWIERGFRLPQLTSLTLFPKINKMTSFQNFQWQTCRM